MGCGIQLFKKPRRFIKVLKKPRRILNVLKILMAFPAGFATLDFSTELVFNIPCNWEHAITVHVSVRSPYKMLELKYSDWTNWECNNDKELRKMTRIKLPLDYYKTATLFATCAGVSIIFTFAILITCMFDDPKTGNLKKDFTLDFYVTVAVALAWLALSSAWAQSVSDLMHYLQPGTLFNFLSVCIMDENESRTVCHIVKKGSYDILCGSVVLGFINFFIWLISSWYICKETIFRQKSIDKEKLKETEEVAESNSKKSADDSEKDKGGDNDDDGNDDDDEDVGDDNDEDEDDNADDDDDDAFKEAVTDLFI